MEADRDRLVELCELVADPQGENGTDYQDLGITRTTRMNLLVFRKAFLWIASLMGVDESYIVSHMLWMFTGNIEINGVMACNMLGRVGLKTPDDGCITFADFRQICLCFRVELLSGRNLFKGRTTVVGIFSKVVARMPVEFQRRRNEYLKGRKEKLELPVELEDRKWVKGWTEFSILMQALYHAIPEGLVPNPVQMCLACAQFTWNEKFT
mmetsp:Transcript_31279/g.93143  ORF Transcript_31279/g.93143 Transcript_31279/m.93143 type:complete len:210 (+) Transcript_31279:1-630(+)